MKGNSMSQLDPDRRKLRARLLALAAGAALACLPLQSALAQPNPFDDYEEGKPPPAFPEDLEEEEELEVPEEAEPKGPVDYRSDQFQFGAGMGLQFAYTGTTNETLLGGDETNRTLFARVTPEGRFFVIDNVEVGLSIGLLSKLSSREHDTQATENNFLFEFSGFYHFPVGAGFALVPGLGLGGYFGSSSRDLSLPDGTVTQESTTTQGFSANLHLTGAYQPHENWRLRTGLTFGFLVGTEFIESQNATLSASAAHVGLPLELIYLF